MGHQTSPSSSTSAPYRMCSILFGDNCHGGRNCGSLLWFTVQQGIYGMEAKRRSTAKSPESFSIHERWWALRTQHHSQRDILCSAPAQITPKYSGWKTDQRRAFAACQCTGVMEVAIRDYDFERMDHRPYSPDLAPSDFAYLKNSNRTFVNAISPTKTSGRNIF